MTGEYEVAKDGGLSPVKTYKYDDKGNEIEEKSFSDGSLSSTTKNIYDNKGNLTEVNSNSEDGSSSYKVIYKNDDLGNKIEETSNSIYNAGSEKEHLTYRYEYDKTGNWIKNVEFEDGKAKIITEREIEYY